jgi:hypothetical protein
MSCSKLDQFETCEATAVANFQKEKSKEMLIGNYVHSYFDNTLDDFINEHPEVFLKNKQELRAEYKLAETMIETLTKDKFCMYLLGKGESEKIFTGEIHGVPWKIRVDKIHENRIVDIKTTKSIHEKEWYNGEKVNFIRRWHYMRRAAVYTEIVRQNIGTLPEFFLTVVSKETPPDKAIVDMNDRREWTIELEGLKETLKRIELLRSGKLEPVRCERCEYCRSTKELNKVIFWNNL